MKSIKTLFILILFILIYTGVFAQGINFSKGKFGDVMNEAKAKKKIVMIDFFTDWCHWCKVLDEKVYSNPQVADYANDKQVNWKIDAEKGEGINLAKKYNVSGYPTILFLSADGAEVDRIVGYMPADEFLSLIKEYNDGKNTFGSFDNALKKNPDDPKANFLMGKKIFDNGDNEGAMKYFEKTIKLDPDNKSEVADDAAYYMALSKGEEDAVRMFLLYYPKSNCVKNARIFLLESSFQNLEGAGTDALAGADGDYQKLFSEYGNTDKEIRDSYGNYLITYSLKLMNDELSTKEQKLEGIEIAKKSLDYLPAGIGQEGWVWYYIADTYRKSGDFNNSETAIIKALGYDEENKLFNDLKEKITKKEKE